MRQVRVVLGCEGCDVWGNTANCVGHTETVSYNFSNSTARTAWVETLVATNHDYGYDGVSLDIEGSAGRGLRLLPSALSMERGPAACAPW